VGWGLESANGQGDAWPMTRRWSIAGGASTRLTRDGGRGSGLGAGPGRVELESVVRSGARLERHVLQIGTKARQNDS
jgi:hypothetical protein